MSTFVDSRLPLIFVACTLLAGCGGSGVTEPALARPSLRLLRPLFSGGRHIQHHPDGDDQRQYGWCDNLLHHRRDDAHFEFHGLQRVRGCDIIQTTMAIAVVSGYRQSAVASAAYTITLTPPQAAAPTVSTSTNNGAQNGAVIVTLASTTSGATIYYTIDGSTPSTSSTQYIAPFMVASNLTLNAIATASGDTNSNVTTQAFSPSIASGTLIWSDEFSNSTSSNTLPSATNWTYDTGYQCCGNNEQETYCAAGSSTSPCDPSSPNAYIAPGGGLNIVAETPPALPTLRLASNPRDFSASNPAASKRR